MYPEPVSYCSFRPEIRPKLVVVVDTEEEFDWGRNFSGENTSVAAMGSIHRLQDILDTYSIRPVYVIDYPVVSQSDGYRPLEEIFQSGRCLIGTHLHPWVNPPFEELVNRHNSFPGNLPRVLEASKLKVLTECVGERFGFKPTIYKAGRYGFGPNTSDILEELDYEVDLSVCPCMDYSVEGGPNFGCFPPSPYWFGRSGRLLEIPLSVGFTGLLRPWAPRAYRFASRGMMRTLRMPAVLARTALLDRIWLSPEGYTSSEQIRLARVLYQDGNKVFSLALHSPSLEPGNTPYVQSGADLSRFLSCCRAFFDFFFGELQGVATTPLDLKREMVQTVN